MTALLSRRRGARYELTFEELVAKHRRPLERYANTLLRRSEHDAEDVVQDVLLRAYLAIRAGEGPQELRPWLFRLTRNRAIDEVRRARWGEAELEDDAVLAADPRDEPESVFRRRETIRRLIDDLADLPVRQRTALLARELDGLTPQQVAAELGVSVPAAQMLATRARENLVKAQAARDADCHEVRGELLAAHESRRRPSEHALRHVEGCPACAAYRKGLKRLSANLRLLTPPIWLTPLAALAKVFGGGTATTTAVAASLVLTVTGGVVLLQGDLAAEGDPAPFALRGERAHLGRDVGRSAPLPENTALVTARVRLPAGRPPEGQRRSVTVQCPPGMRIIGFQAPEQRLPLTYGFRAADGFGLRKGTIDFTSEPLARAYEVTVGVLCRQPDAQGSLAENPRRTRRGEEAAKVCARSAYLYESPGRLFRGTVHIGQPVSILRRSASRQWALVVSDTRNEGWIKVSALCG